MPAAQNAAMEELYQLFLGVTDEAALLKCVSTLKRFLSNNQGFLTIGMVELPNAKDVF